MEEEKEMAEACRAVHLAGNRERAQEMLDRMAADRTLTRAQRAAVLDLAEAVKCLGPVCITHYTISARGAELAEAGHMLSCAGEWADAIEHLLGALRCFSDRDALRVAIMFSLSVSYVGAGDLVPAACSLRCAESVARSVLARPEERAHHRLVRSFVPRARAARRFLASVLKAMHPKTPRIEVAYVQAECMNLLGRAHTGRAIFNEAVRRCIEARDPSLAAFVRRVLAADEGDKEEKEIIGRMLPVITFQ